MKIFGKIRVAVALLSLVYILIPLLVTIPASFTRTSAGSPRL